MRSFFYSVMWLLVAVPQITVAQIPEGADPKMPVPADVELAAARTRIDSVFSDDLKGAKTSARASVARELLDMAGDPKDRFEEYAMLDRALELAIDAKSLTLVNQVIDAMDKSFKIDARSLRAESSKAIAGGSASQARTLSQLATIDNAAKANPAAAAEACYQLAKRLRGPFQQEAAGRAIQYYGKSRRGMKKLERRQADARVQELKELTQNKNQTKKPASRSTRENRNSDLACWIGKWDIFVIGKSRKGEWDVRKDGTIQTKKDLARWQAKDDCIVIQWPNGNLDYIRRPLDPKGVFGDSGKKGPAYFVLKRN